ncbi:MAG: flagellar basal body P-ring formation protein FlgA [Proteobacteria bacterium]|nr:flagellar basal body P-ring formation protein FlgA [Pseudomonadota bacterium]
MKNLTAILKRSLLIFFAMSLFSNNVFCKESHSLENISKTAHDFVLEQLQNADEEIQVVVGHLDPRLRLHLCTIPLEAFSQNYETLQGISTVGVRCNDTKPWTLYVPVSVRNYKMVVTLKHAVIRNTILTDKDVSLKKMNINRLSSGYFEDLAQIKGKILTQNLSKGVVLTKHHIKLPMAVSRGQSVTLIAKNPVIEVRTKGVAMTKGAIGDRIKVKNTKSKRIIEGVIIDKDLISVNL